MKSDDQRLSASFRAEVGECCSLALRASERRAEVNTLTKTFSHEQSQEDRGVGDRPVHNSAIGRPSVTVLLIRGCEKNKKRKRYQAMDTTEKFEFDSLCNAPAGAI